MEKKDFQRNYENILVFDVCYKMRVKNYYFFVTVYEKMSLGQTGDRP